MRTRSARTPIGAARSLARFAQRALRCGACHCALPSCYIAGRAGHASRSVLGPARPAGALRWGRRGVAPQCRPPPPDKSIDRAHAAEATSDEQRASSSEQQATSNGGAFWRRPICWPPLSATRGAGGVHGRFDEPPLQWRLVRRFVYGPVFAAEKPPRPRRLSQCRQDCNCRKSPACLLRAIWRRASRAGFPAAAQNRTERGAAEQR